MSRATLIQELYFWEFFEILKFSPFLVRASRSYFKANLRFLKSIFTKVSRSKCCTCSAQLKAKSCIWRWAYTIFVDFLEILKFSSFLLRPSRSYFKAYLRFLKSILTKVSMSKCCTCSAQLKAKSCI